MAARMFMEASERIDGKFTKVTRVCCRKCGVSTNLNIAAAGGTLPPEVIANKFAQKGWEIGPNSKWDLCPGCANAAKEKKAPMLKVVEQEKPSPSETPPREMTRDDRRIIISKLDAVYLDSKRGYDAGWSDQKVASDLGVPRKWVETIRAENFGDIGGNEEMAEFYAEAQAALAQAHKIMEDHNKAIEKINEATRRSFAELNGRLTKVEKLADAVRKYVVA